MSGYRLPVALVCCTITVALAGCGLFRTYRPLTVQVIDGETRQPLAGAEVSVSYPNMLDFTAPIPRSGKTDETGTVAIPVAEYHSTQLSGALAGYYQLHPYRVSTESVTREPMRQISPIIELWKSPAPKIEVIVPDGYRGPVKVVYETTPPETYELGRRMFTFRADRSGCVTVSGPAFLNGFLTDVTARHESGGVIPSPSASRPEEVAFRWVDCDQLPDGHQSQLFVVGTEADGKALWERVNRQLDYNTWTPDHEAYARLIAK